MSQRPFVVHSKALIVVLFAVGCATAEDLGQESEGRGTGGDAGDSGRTGGTAGTGGNSSVPGTGGAVVAPSGGASAGGSGGAFGGGAGAGVGGSVGSGGSTGVPPGELLFFDDFESGTMSKWIANTTGDWSVVNDGGYVLRQGTVSNTLRVAAAGDVGWTDQVVQAKVRVRQFGGSSTSYLVGVYARFANVDNHYYVALRYDGRIVIRAKLGGSNTSLSSAIDAGIVTNTWYTVKLEVKGSTLNAYLDDALKATATDSSIAAGGIAVGTTNSTADFDDVSMTVPQ